MTIYVNLARNPVGPKRLPSGHVLLITVPRVFSIVAVFLLLVLIVVTVFLLLLSLCVYVITMCVCVICLSVLVDKGVEWYQSFVKGR